MTNTSIFSCVSMASTREFLDAQPQGTMVRFEWYYSVDEDQSIDTVTMLKVSAREGDYWADINSGECYDYEHFENFDGAVFAETAR